MIFQIDNGIVVLEIHLRLVDQWCPVRLFHELHINLLFGNSGICGDEFPSAVRYLRMCLSLSLVLLE